MKTFIKILIATLVASGIILVGLSGSLLVDAVCAYNPILGALVSFGLAVTFITFIVYSVIFSKPQDDGVDDSVKMNVALNYDAYVPDRAHSTDAGLDLRARQTKVVGRKSCAVFDTGVCVELPPNTVGFLKSKSGLNVKHGITSDGVIDEGYTGTITVKLYNHSNEDYVVHEGDKISQLVILPVLKPELNPTDISEFAKTERGDNGFGSSGR